jgi:hypothetical protein
MISMVFPIFISAILWDSNKKFMLLRDQLELHDFSEILKSAL